MEEKKYGQYILETGNGKLYFRYAEGSEDAKAEILTDNPVAIQCLTNMAKENPDVITVLTKEGEEHFHCIVGPEFQIFVIPATKSIEYWIVKPDEDEEDESIEEE